MTARLVVDALMLVLPERLVPTHDGSFKIVGEGLATSVGDPLCADLTEEMTLRETLRSMAAEEATKCVGSDEVVIWKQQHWLVTRALDDLEEYELPHDCDQCRQGLALSRELVTKGECVALATLTYWVVPAPPAPQPQGAL